MKTSLSDRPRGMLRIAGSMALALLAASSLTACGGGLGINYAPVRTHGYVYTESTATQIPVGSSREQVELVLGSPSTTSTISGDTYYYISQAIREDPIMGRSIVDQHVLAVYFDKDHKVERLANYGLKDGKVFDFIQRQTRSGGAEVSLIGQMLQGVGNISPIHN